MRYFPIFVDCEQLNVLVVGGGEVATRKVELMLKTPANVTVVSPELTPSLTAMVEQKRIHHVEECYRESQLEGVGLVFVATDNHQLNVDISEDAKKHKIMANVVDTPALCKFITPSIVDRSPMTIALCSEGNSPVLLRYWREKLETLIPHTLGTIARFAGEKRRQVKDSLDSVNKRRRFWERFFSAEAVQKAQNLEQAFHTLLELTDNDIEAPGELTVIKTPAHPDQLTLAQLRKMQEADIGLYDDTVSPAIIDMLRRDAERHLLEGNVQTRIDDLLAQGQRICYLSDLPQTL